MVMSGKPVKMAEAHCQEKDGMAREVVVMGVSIMLA